jgi:deoxyadenosine/deoxycytidine kinase
MESTTAYICLSGNIGAGKTSVGRALAQRMGVCFVEEPVAAWKRSGLLDQFYRDPHAAAYPLQMYVLSTRLKALSDATMLWEDEKGAPPSTVLLDRWLWDDRIFAENAHSSGYMSDDEFSNYTAALKTCLQSAPMMHVKRILIAVPPKTCYERIEAREGKPIELAYLEKLHDRHTHVPYDITVSNVTTVSDAVTQICEYIQTL